MERTGEVAAVSRGKEPLIKRVWYGVGKFADSQKPEAWGNRIIHVIDTKIIPRLTPDQQQWAQGHKDAIRDAAMYAGVGITTAEIVGSVVAIEKLAHLRERLFGSSVAVRIPLERAAEKHMPGVAVEVLDPVGALVKSMDHMPKGFMDYLRTIVRAGEHSGLDTFGQFGLAATLLTVILNKGNPEYAPLFADLAGIAGGNEYQALQPGMRKLFERAYADTAKRYRWDPRALDPGTLFDHWVQENAPGAKRVLQASGVPIGRAKHLVGLMRGSSMRPDVLVQADIPLYQESGTDLPGFNFVLKKLQDTPPPVAVYNQMRDAVRVLSRQGSAVSKEQRLNILRRLAGEWADHAMPNLAKRPEARRAFLAQLEREGFPGMPRATVQSMQEYLSREYLPVSRSVRVLDKLSDDLPHIFESREHHTHRTPRITISKPNEKHQTLSSEVQPTADEIERQEASREQSRRQLEQNAYIRELKSAVRKIKKDERSAIVRAIDERLRPERERLEKISAIHTIARETPGRVQKIVKRVEALRARLKLRRELKEKARAAKTARQSDTVAR